MPHPSRHLGSYTGPFALRMFFRAVLLVGMVLICSGCRPADRGPIVQLTDSGKQDEHQEHEHFPEHWPEDIMQASKRISELLGGTAGSTQGISTSLELADLVGWLPVLAADSDLGREDFARIDAWSSDWSPLLRKHAQGAQGLEGLGNLDQLTQMSKDLDAICRAEQARIDELVRRFSE
ncbi:MAG: hypothetical protein ACKN85_06420 [Pirellula sp.]|nr:hypothetical protein [Planctomycetota bacterium]